MVEYKILLEILIICLICFAFFKAGVNRGIEIACNGGFGYDLNNSITCLFKPVETLNNTFNYVDYVDLGGLHNDSD